ncbi:ras GEF [Rhizodiscina lignyota]|uniref:Ras GEF n=1 Tax=Rhizodiscina lignyota TaxID=1504668 RepID=A0A9P4MB73_9PEZI|nr:ras GEF [Rhizodiscina lignyota]
MLVHKVSHEDIRASAMVPAPLAIGKDLSRSRSTGVRSANSSHTRQSSGKTQRTMSLKSKSNPSPPLTPRTSREEMDGEEEEEEEEEEPTFHNYMRAFYPFHPSSTVSSSSDANSITVPINQGDVILIHSVHPNGWADGTLLASGARGWLPTNYCEAYDHETIRSLLNALTQLWDLVKNNQVDNLAAFTRQDYVRAIIAGVRIFLEKTRCLNRESELIQSQVSLRRLRKGLLGDLSALVKIAKRLQELVQSAAATQTVYEALDELVLKAFKVVIRAVRFLDIWSQDVRSAHTSVDYAESTKRPPTPPSDTQTVHTVETDALSTANIASDAGTDSIIGEVSQELTQRRTVIETPAVYSPTTSSSTTNPKRTSSMPSRRHSKRLSVSHRASYIGNSTGIRSPNLASERLNAAHDAFLGYIGSFIGLHLQSRSSSDLLHITRQSVIASRKLLLVADEVWERDGRRSGALEQAKDAMYARLAELVQATKDVLSPASFEDDVFMPDQGKQLVLAATSCVRAAGECVSKTRSVIELIGDFEFEPVGLGLPDTIFQDVARSETSEKHKVNPSIDGASSVHSTDKPLPPPPQPMPPQPTEPPPPPPLDIPTVTVDSKPLPEPPAQSPVQTLEDLDAGQADEAAPTEIVSRSSIAESFERSESPQIVIEPVQSPTESNPRMSLSLRASRVYNKGIRSDSVNESIPETSSTYPSSIRDDGASILSQNSTRATTPDRSPINLHSNDSTMLSSYGSTSELQSMANDDVTGLEEVILEKTYAHELIHNKDGQVTGGSLPALVEKLTTHDTTPDATFVTTFYLTFRLFTTPQEFARSLIDRFENVGGNAKIGVPVRLRVYNVMKGWLESHWQADTDASALPTITEFANGQLKTALPAAGKRLVELTSKVTELKEGSIAPRLVSSLGKSSTSATVFSVPDSSMPNPIISKGQLNALRHAMIGGSPCSITDFDPLELARQFTIIESRIFCSIGPEELLGSEWTKKVDSKAVNVRAMSTLSTDLANLVAETILQLEDPKKRAAMIKQWIKVAAKCLELNNYDSLMAIICSLNSSMVLRLKRTWEHVSQKTKAKYDELVSIVDVGRNYAVLRQRLQNHVAPCIPFVGIYLTDLTFVDVGNQSTRQLPGDGSGEGTSVINFDKHMKTAKIIGQFQRFQVPYKLAAIPEMQDWMNSQIQRMRSSDQANVQSYYRRSLLLEPRETQNSKLSPGDSGASIFSNDKKEGFDLWASFSFKRPSHQRQPSNTS